MISFRLLLATLIPGVLAPSFAAEQEATPRRALVKSGDAYQAFLSPSADARPMTFWAWEDNRVRPQDIPRALDGFQKAGLGGVYLFPINWFHNHGPNEPAPVEFLSEEFSKLVCLTTQEAAKRNLVVDWMAGTGWPHGGPWVKPEDGHQKIELADLRKIKGPTKLSLELPRPEFGPADASGRRERLYDIYLLPAKASAPVGHLKSLRSLVRADGTFEYRVPAGECYLFQVNHLLNYRGVKHFTPGDEGPVADNFNYQAVKSCFEHMSTRLVQGFPDKQAMARAIRAVVVNSVEIEGANWTGGFLEKFQARRGYDVAPYLPLVVQETFIPNMEAKQKGKAPLVAQSRAVRAAREALLKASPELAATVDRVRYDWCLTLGELFQEGFLKAAVDWCHENGWLACGELYGVPWNYGDMVDAHMLIDVPQGETWLFNAGWDQKRHGGYVVGDLWTPVVSSAAHLAGRKLISCESMTSPQGGALGGLEDIKQGVEMNFFSGANQMTYHMGYYLPPDVPFPGWLTIGTLFSEHNTWWPHFKLANDYFARVAAVAQESQPVAQVAVLPPLADTWSTKGPWYAAYYQTPWYCEHLWYALQNHGFGRDFVSERVLQQAACKGGRMSFGPMSYEMLVLEDVNRLQPETAEAVYRFAAAGGRVLFVDRAPNEAPGLLDHEPRSLRVKENISRCLAEFPQRVRVVPGPTKVEVPSKPRNQVKEESDNRRAVVAWLGDVLKSSGWQAPIRFSRPDAELFQIQFRDRTRDLCFFGNISTTNEVDQEVELADLIGRAVWEWDAHTGRRMRYPLLPGNKIRLQLGPSETCLVALEPDGDGPLKQFDAVDRSVLTTLAGPWETEWRHMNGKTIERTLSSLADPSQDKELSTFAGQIVYRTEFDVADIRQSMLSPGQVRGVVRVTLNGQDLGVKYYGRREFDLSPALKPGRNRLELSVTTPMYNYWITLRTGGRQKTEPVWCGLLGPVGLYRRK
jgi:hypothetical protein